MYPEIASIWELPPAETLSELSARVRKLELLARKNSFNFLQGNYLTRVKGNGLDFHEARRYVYGESIRHIDWNITARMCDPYVRVYNEEREREIFVVIDVSPSMHTGWQSRKKIEYAVELASTIAYSAVSAGDKLGYITYSDRLVDFSLPVTGKVQLFNALRAFYTNAVKRPGPCKETDMREAIHRIQRINGKKFMIFFISDFVENDIPEDLRYLQAKHEVSLFHIFDPFEYEELNDASILASSPEGKSVHVSIHPGTVYPFERIRKSIKDSAGKRRIKYKEISTGVPMKKTLNELFHYYRRR